MSSGATETNYPFAWLDEVIEVAMNPNLTNIHMIEPADLRQIMEKFPAEARQVFRSLKSQCLCLLSHEKNRIAVEEYDTAVLELARQAKRNMEACTENDLWVETGRLILAELERLSASIHKRYRKYLPKKRPEIGEEPEGMNDFQKLLFKVLLTLSVDQIGIILNAAFNAGVILGESFRKVCKVVAPYLSTQRYKHISEGGIRTGAIKQEDRDKVIAVETLKRIIDDIEGH